MSKTSDGAKGQPQYASSGNPPTFAADLTGLSDYYASRAFQHYSTAAALLADVSDKDTDDVALATNAPGAWWRFNGSTWEMHGTPRFADSGARSTALSAPVAGWKSYLADTKLEYLYDGTSWTTPVPSGLVPVTPTSLSGTGAALSGSRIVGTAIGTGGLSFQYATSDYDSYQFVIKAKSIVTGGSLRLRVRTAAGADLSSGTYLAGYQQTTGAGAPTYVWSATDTSAYIGDLRASTSVPASSTFMLHLPLDAQDTIIRGETSNRTVMTPFQGVVQNAIAYAGATIFTTAGTADLTVDIYGLKH